jgi:uncharacterized protein YjbI with pentapeptide repeats
VHRPECSAGAKISYHRRRGEPKSPTVAPSRADLSRAELYFACLSHGRLCGTNLRRAILSFANLEWADLGGADLEGANIASGQLARTHLDPRQAQLFGVGTRTARSEEPKRAPVTKGRRLPP